MKIKKIILFFLFIFTLSFSLISCNDYPKDPRDSWKNVQTEGLKVGVVNNPPFTSVENDSFDGSEVKMIREFANNNKVQVKFEKGNETDLIDKLEHFKLDVVIGGFTKKTLWKKKAGPTVMYDKEKHIFLIPKGENKLLTHLDRYLLKIKQNEKS